MAGWMSDRGGMYIGSLILASILLCPGWTKYGISFAEQKAEESVSQEEIETPAFFNETSEYHTPLAGESLHTIFVGKSIDIPAMDRARVTAIMLGGVLFFSQRGKHPLPLLALST